MMGRETRRISDRIDADERAEGWFQKGTRQGHTVDVSETGIALRFSEKVPVESGEFFRVEITAENYHALLDARCVYSGQNGFVTATVIPDTETDRRNWFQIIHDREHSLPREIDPWMTVYDEITRNIRMRWKIR